MRDWHDIPPEYHNQIVTGDARELAKRIPDESIDLIFTDPVYDRIDDYRWLAETAGRVLKDGSSILAYAGHWHQLRVGAAMLDSGLTPRPMLTTWMSPPYPRLWACKMHVNYSFVLWLSKGQGQPNTWVVGELGQAYQNKNNGFKWGKNFGAIFYYLEAFTQPGDIILDTYTGGGTVPAVCKMLGRNYVAFEIDPTTAERARARVRDTQPPLFVLQPEQMELFK